MDRLISTLQGGMPLHLNDIEFLQNSIREVFKASPEAFSRVHGGTYVNNLRMSGTSYTVQDNGTTWEVDVKEGYIFAQGEILFVPAHVFDTGISSGNAQPTETDLNTNTTYDLVVTNDPVGEDTFNDGSTKDTYEVRRAKCSWDGGTAFNNADGITTFPQNKYLAVNGPFVSDRILRDVILNNYPSTSGNTVPSFLMTKTLGDITEGFQDLTLKNGWNDFQPAQFKKDLEGFVWVKGKLDNGSATDQTFATLPSGYRPPQTLFFPVTAAGDYDVSVHLSIATSGDMALFASTSNSDANFVPNPNDIYINTVRFEVGS